MAKSLLEAYKNRIDFANKNYAETHNGEKMSQTRVLALAKCLENTNKFLNEA